MARIALTCACGWNFFIPGSTPGHEVACPSCTRAVSIPGRKPGMDAPLSPGEIAARVQRRAATVRLLMGLGLIVAAGATFPLWKGLLPVGAPSEPPASSDPRLKADPASRPPRGNPPIAGPRPAALPVARVQELRRRVLENVRLVNMASVLSECLRNRNLAREWSEVQSAVAAYEVRIKADLAELAGANETMALEPYFSEGDRIVSFGSRDFTSLKRVDAAKVLHAWMNAWRSGTGLELVTVLRDDRRQTLHLHFPEDTKELLLLLRHPALQLEPLPDRDPGQAEPAVAVTEPDAVARAVEAIATEVTSRSDVFSDVVTEMRRRTESLATTEVPIWPDESVRGIALIGNPLTFKPGEMTTAALAEIGAWWGSLTPEQRTRFATYFGLSCAYTRARTPKK